MQYKSSYLNGQRNQVMSQTQKEQFICRLSYLRQKLRDIHLGIKDDGLLLIHLVMSRDLVPANETNK